MDNTPAGYSCCMDAEAAVRGKKRAGYEAAGLISDGMVIGLGTGSTVLYTMERVGVMVREGMAVAGVPTSFQTAIRARDFGIPLTTLDDHPVLDLAIDGADQVDPLRRLIKGRGAALTREKCVAAAADRLIIVVDPTKIVRCLDAAVPVEVLPFAATTVAHAINRMGGRSTLREGSGKDGPVVTDNGNFVLDCTFGRIEEPELLEDRLTALPGVITCGLFTGFCEKTTVITGDL